MEMRKLHCHFVREVIPQPKMELRIEKAKQKKKIDPTHLRSASKTTLDEKKKLEMKRRKEKLLYFKNKTKQIDTLQYKFKE